MTEGVDKDAFWAHAKLTLETAVKFKRVMQRRGLLRAQTKCPRCGVEEALQGSLAGRKQHMRMWCKTAGCQMDMLE